jgi:hypothetical protein
MRVGLLAFLVSSVLCPVADAQVQVDAETTLFRNAAAKAFRVFIGDAAVAPPGTTLVSTAEQAERLGLQILPATVPVSPAVESVRHWTFKPGTRTVSR